MDENKLAKLREVEYKIPRTCRWCRHFQIRKEWMANLTDWTVCRKHAYFHLKHQDERQMSISAYGTCPNWKPFNDLLVRTFGHGWMEFLEGEF
jgi:hypothetical protein